MTLAVRAGTLLVALGFASVAAQTPAGTVSGQVVAAATGRPIPGAMVMYNESDAGRTLAVDADGRFQFQLGSSQYHLRASAPGYILHTYGREPMLGDTLIALPPGGNLTGLVLRLHRGSTIAGRVVDERGDPVVRGTIRPFRRSGAPGNALVIVNYARLGVSLGALPRTETDDRGEYRLTGLEPGDYLIGVVDRTSVTFAPGTATLKAATPVRVGIDEEKPGVNIQVKSVPLGTIAGTISGPRAAGTPAPQVSVELTPDPDEGSLPAVRATAQGERFEFSGIPAGRYTLFVRPGPTLDAPRVWARESVVVSADAVAARPITLRAGGRVAGRAMSESTMPLRALMRLELGPIGADRSASRTLAAVGDDGSFVFAGLSPGSYQWMPSMLYGVSSPRILAAYLKNEDVTDVPLVIGPTTVIDNMRVAIETAAEIVGTVRDAADRPATAGAVIVAPLDRRHVNEVSRRLRVVRADTNGVFRVRGLPAGKYRVTHVAQLAYGQAWDPAFLDKLAGWRETVATAGQTARVELRLR